MRLVILREHHSTSWLGAGRSKLFCSEAKFHPVVVLLVGTTGRWWGPPPDWKTPIESCLTSHSGNCQFGPFKSAVPQDWFTTPWPLEESCSIVFGNKHDDKLKGASNNWDTTQCTLLVAVAKKGCNRLQSFGTRLQCLFPNLVSQSVSDIHICPVFAQNFWVPPPEEIYSQLFWPLVRNLDSIECR